jgi:hypothetical protein
VQTRSVLALWSQAPRAIPFPREFTDNPMQVGLWLDGKDVPKLIIDPSAEMLEQSRPQALAIGIAQARGHTLIQVTTAR